MSMAGGFGAAAAAREIKDFVNAIIAEEETTPMQTLLLERVINKADEIISAGESGWY